MKRSFRQIFIMDSIESSEMDAFYSPHNFTKRMTPEDVLKFYIKSIDKSSEDLKKTLRCEFNIPYGIGEREKYDILGIDLPEDTPILIFIHGGYWQVEELTHSNHAHVASVLHKHNIKTITIGYELCPRVSVPEIIRNIQIAVKLCLQYAKKCKSKGVFLAGHSVGAHLVASMFESFIHTLSKEEQSLIKAAFLICGIYDLTALTQTVSINKPLKLDEAVAMNSSPLLQTISSGNAIEFHVIVAEYDSPPLVAQGKAFHEKLVDSEIKSKYHFLKEYDHFNAVEDLTKEDFELTKLIIQTVCLNTK